MQSDLRNFSHRLNLPVLFCLIAGMGLSIDWGNQGIGFTRFHSGQVFLALGALYFLVNLLSNLLADHEKSLFDEELKQTRVLYSSFLFVPGTYIKFLRVLVLPAAGVFILVFFFSQNNDLPYGLLALMGVLLIGGIFPPLKEWFFSPKSKIWITESGVFYHLAGYEEIHWSDLHSVMYENMRLRFRLEEGDQPELPLQYLQNRQFRFLKVLRQQLEKHQIKTNLPKVTNSVI